MVGETSGLELAIDTAEAVQKDLLVDTLTSRVDDVSIFTIKSVEKGIYEAVDELVDIILKEWERGFADIIVNVSGGLRVFGVIGWVLSKLPDVHFVSAIPEFKGDQEVGVRAYLDTREEEMLDMMSPSTLEVLFTIAAQQVDFDSMVELASAVSPDRASEEEAKRVRHALSILEKLRYIRSESVQTTRRIHLMPRGLANAKAMCYILLRDFLQAHPSLEMKPLRLARRFLDAPEEVAQLIRTYERPGKVTPSFQQRDGRFENIDQKILWLAAQVLVAVLTPRFQEE